VGDAEHTACGTRASGRDDLQHLLMATLGSVLLAFVGLSNSGRRSS
jgi:hypothetical protein